MNQQQIFAEYLDHMGSDLTVVNAARASFGKESEWSHRYTTEEEYADGAPAMVEELKPADASLIRFLATGYRTTEWDGFLTDLMMICGRGCLDANDVAKVKADLTTLLRGYKRKAQHWAPFAHPHVQIRVRMPLFLARQFVKHQIGGTWSEESRRYISDDPGVWFPDEWHTRPEDIKQGSGGLVEHQSHASELASAAAENSIDTYGMLLATGVAPEEARIVLPLNMMTTVVWTGSLLF